MYLVEGVEVKRSVPQQIAAHLLVPITDDATLTGRKRHEDARVREEEEEEQLLRVVDISSHQLQQLTQVFHVPPQMTRDHFPTRGWLGEGLLASKTMLDGLVDQNTT